MPNNFITIFTPTFNRKYRLPTLYQSLLNQNIKNFTWLIIDDGSTDNTQALVKQWIQDNKISIKYIFKKNGGKISALKEAINNSDSILFMTIDSDDILLPDAIEIIYNKYISDSNLFRNNTCIGYLAYSRNLKSNCIDSIPHHSTRTPFINFFEIKDLYKYRGESTWILLTNSLKTITIPYFKGEKFLIDDVYKFMLSHTNNLLLLNDILVEYEYMPDGLTSANKSNLFKDSINGYALYHLIYAMLSTKMFHRVKSYAKFLALKKLANLDIELINNYSQQITINHITPATRLLSYLYLNHYKTKFKKEFF